MNNAHKTTGMNRGHEQRTQPAGTSAPSAPYSAPDGILRDAEWQTILDTNLQPGELLAIVAAAGAGKSTVLKDYARRRHHEGAPLDDRHRRRRRRIGRRVDVRVPAE